MTRAVGADVWLIVEGRREWGPVNQDTGEKDISSANIVGMRKSRPGTLSRDQIAVKVKVNLPGSIFNNPLPSVVIDVPEDFVVRGPIEVTVVPPGE